LSNLFVQQKIKETYSFYPHKPSKFNFV